MQRFRYSFPIALVVLWTLSAAQPAAGQSLTGSIVGTVKDAQRGALAGAVVRIASPALMTAETQTTTSDKGEWRFPVLPPGRYIVSVTGHATFAPYRSDSLDLGVGQTLEVSVILQLANVTESVTVTAGSEVLSRGSSLETRFGSEYIRTIPSRRYSMFDLIRSTPGVSPTSPASGTVNTVSVFGSSVNENGFLIDGTNFTCPCQGVSRAEPIVDVIQEVHVVTMGASVEFGNIQGGLFNVVTKQGGARFTGETSYYAQPSASTAQPIVLPVSGTQASSGYERVTYRDWTAGVGGPISRDRLWFYGAYQYLRDYDSQPGTDPAYPRTYEQNKIFGKLTWRLGHSLNLMNSYHRENWVNPTVPTRSTPFIATQRVNASVPSMTFANMTQALSDRTVWEARIGRFLLHQDSDPSSGDRTTPSHRDQATDVVSVNAPQIGGLFLDRLTAKALVHRYQPGPGGSDHHLKAGMQFERGEHRLRQVSPGGVQYVDLGGTPVEAVYRGPAALGGVFLTSSLFASDSIMLKARLTIDAGLRYDHSQARIPDRPAVDALGYETDGVSPGLGTVFTWNEWSPRAGVVMKLDSTGRTTVRASYGRFNAGVLTGELDPISPGTPITTRMGYDAATGGYTRLISTVNPTVQNALDPDLHAPHTDELAMAVERELRRRVRASVAYISKRGSGFIGWTDTGGSYQEATRSFGDGRTVTVYELTNGTASRRFVLTNPDSLFMHYDGVVTAVEKPLSNGWQASASYTYSRAYGLLATSNATADSAQFSTIARPGYLTFGQDPNNLTNATGRLPNDRPHILRATGSVHLPWQRILLAANLQQFSGKPWAATTPVALPQGTQTIMLEPRGSRRLPSQTLLDARVSKTVAIGQSGTMDLIFDVLNVFNDTAAEAIVSDNVYGSTFGRPSQFVDPRRAMLGIRLNLGR